MQDSKASVGSRSIVYLIKKEESKWWNRLLKQEGKTPVFVKVDWDRWVDEDEQDEKGKLFLVLFVLVEVYNRYLICFMLLMCCL